MLRILLLCCLVGCASKEIDLSLYDPPSGNDTFPELPYCYGNSGVQCLDMIHFTKPNKKASRMFTKAHYKQLLRTVEFLKSHPGTMVQIEGHVNSSGNLAQDLKFGKQMAMVARKFLIKKGISPDRFYIVSFGSEKPRVEPVDSVANLRLEQVVMGK